MSTLPDFTEIAIPFDVVSSPSSTSKFVFHGHDLLVITRMKVTHVAVHGRLSGQVGVAYLAL